MPKDKHFPEWRKKKTRMSREPPLPVPVTSTTGILQTRQNWYCFTGYLQGSAVVVKHSGDIDFLYRMVSIYCWLHERQAFTLIL